MTTDPGHLVFDTTCVRKGMRILCPQTPEQTFSQNPDPSVHSIPPISSSPAHSIPPISGGAEGGAFTPTPALPEFGEGVSKQRGIELRAIETLQPGDMVFGHDGQPHLVLHIIRKMYRGQMVCIRQEKSEKLLWLTADHRVLAKKRPRTLGGNRDWSAVPTHHFGYAKQMRHEPTYGERVLWNALRGKQLGVKFRRQHPIGPFIADFYSREAALVVEVDGATHHGAEEREYDRQRDAYLRSTGLDVLRFSDEEVSQNPDAVCLAIENKCRLRFKAVEGAEWVQAGSLLAGDIVYARSPTSALPDVGEGAIGPAKGRPVSVRVAEMRCELSAEEVYDLQVEGVHSFITEVCAVHNCGSGTTGYMAEQCDRRRMYNFAPITEHEI